MKNKLIRLFLITISTGIIFFSSCEKEKVYPPSQNTIEELYSIMDYWYYWKDSIPDIASGVYDGPGDLLEAMRFTPRDKWSYITTKEAHSQYYEEGTYIGYGFSYAPDADGNIRITFTFEDSDLNSSGIGRGWIIKKINNTVVNSESDINSLLGNDVIGESNTLEFESPTGEIVSEVFTKKLIAMNTVGYENVYNAGISKVGYFVFKSFIGPSLEELDNVFSYFNTEGVNELVVDLRYNGGGRLDVVEKLASYIIPDDVNGKVFVKYEFNMDRADKNESTIFKEDDNSLRLNKVYFITSKGSASASEVIINSLTPYLDVYLVGDDTYGKPVGMYSFSSNVSNLVYVPVTFKLLNADDFGGYYNGLKADSYVEDDISTEFGVGEATLDEVLYHIENGTFPSLKSAEDIYRRPVKDIRGIKDERGAV